MSIYLLVNPINLSDPNNSTENITSFIDTKNVTIHGSEAVFNDDLLHIIITKDEISATNLYENYQKYTIQNDKTFLTNTTDFYQNNINTENSNVEQVFLYSQTYSLIYLQPDTLYFFARKLLKDQNIILQIILYLCQNLRSLHR